MRFFRCRKFSAEELKISEELEKKDDGSYLFDSRNSRKAVYSNVDKSKKRK